MRAAGAPCQRRCSVLSLKTKITQGSVASAADKYSVLPYDLAPSEVSTPCYVYEAAHICFSYYKKKNASWHCGILSTLLLFIHILLLLVPELRVTRVSQ